MPVRSAAMKFDLKAYGVAWMGIGGEQGTFPGTILDAELEIPEAATAKNLPVS